MDLALSDEQEQLVASFSDLFAKESASAQVRAAEPLGHDPALWEHLVEIGSTTMGVAEASGGWGATLLDLALVAELVGRFVAPAPVIEAQVAARLLAAVDSPGADEVLQAGLEGSALVTLALRPVDVGQMPLVPAGAIADFVVARDGERLVVVATDGQDRRPVDNLGALPLADLVVGDAAVVIADGDAARSLHETAIDEWLTLTAAALVGIGSRALEMGAEYAVLRRAWGVPIGTFQAISHPLADSATAVDGARLLARKAAWSAEADPGRRSELAAMAFAFASETARDATYHSLHIHGGYGFVLEHDVQLYYRRARAWARVWGDPRAGYRRAAAHRYGQES